MTGSNKPPVKTVNLPSFTKKDAVAAARAGMNRAEYEEWQNKKRAAERPEVCETGQARRWVPVRGEQGRIEIDEAEYSTLCLVAAITKRFLPHLEATPVPVTFQPEWAALVESINNLGVYGWGGFDVFGGPGATVANLLEILHETR